MKNEIKTFLESNKDDAYASFNERIIKDDLKVIGIKYPLILSFAKEHIQNIDEILLVPDNNIYEIRLIKLFTVSMLKDIDKYKEYFEKCIPLITSWSLCDAFIMHSKVIKKDRAYFFDRACKLIKDKEEFSKRIGFILFLAYFVTDDYVDKVLDEIKKCKTNGYYSDMALAWLLCELYIKYTDKAKEYIVKNNIDKNIIRMTIRKIKDSYRVSKEDKEWLKKIGN